MAHTTSPLFDPYESCQPAVDLPIAREGLMPDEKQTLTRENFANAQKNNVDLAHVRQWVEHASVPTPDELLALSPVVMARAQLLPELFLCDDVLQLRRADEPTRPLTVVPWDLVETVIRY